jgi:hypothetical protein
MREINKTLRSNIPELENVDTQIQSYNQALAPLEQKPYNIDTSMPDEVQTKLIKLVLKSNQNTPEGVAAKNTLNDYFNKLRIANPDMASKLEARITDWSARGKVLNATDETMYLPRPLARPQPLASKVGAIGGYAVGSITPDWARNTARVLMSEGSQASQSLGRVIGGMAEKDEHTRNALMFGLMQQPAYRQILKPHLPQEAEKVK